MHPSRRHSRIGLDGLLPFFTLLFFLFFCGPVTLSWILVICQQRLLWLIFMKLDLGWSTVKYLFIQNHIVWVNVVVFLVLQTWAIAKWCITKRLKRYFIIPTPQNKSEPTTPINTCKSGLLWIWLAAVILLNLSTMATLGTEKTDCCREVYTRVNVWTVRQKSDRCREVYTRNNVWTVRQKSDCCREV